jgi:hypothetical protein
MTCNQQEEIMPSVFFAWVCSVIVFPSPSDNAPQLADIERSVQNFSYEGVAIGVSLEDFKRMFPNAKLQQTTRSNVVALYAPLADGDKFIVVEFFQGSIYYMGVTFGRNLLAGLGGRRVLEARITDKFGLPHSVDGTISYWRFPQISRKLGYRQSPDGSSTLLIIDTEANDQRKKKGIGF